MTYGTSFMASTWAWRIPSAIQGIFSILCIVILPFIPESPRWLVFQGQHQEALKVLAQTHTDGVLSPHRDGGTDIVQIQYREIVDAIEFEKKNTAESKILSLTQIVRTPVARKRMILALSAAVFSTLAGAFILRS